jgi:hypothetical protein
MPSLWRLNPPFDICLAVVQSKGGFSIPALENGLEQSVVFGVRHRTTARMRAMQQRGFALFG